MYKNLMLSTAISLISIAHSMDLSENEQKIVDEIEGYCLEKKISFNDFNFEISSSKNKIYSSSFSFCLKDNMICREGDIITDVSKILEKNKMDLYLIDEDDDYLTLFFTHTTEELI